MGLYGKGKIIGAMEILIPYIVENIEKSETGEYQIDADSFIEKLNLNILHKRKISYNDILYIIESICIERGLIVEKIAGHARMLNKYVFRKMTDKDIYNPIVTTLTKKNISRKRRGKGCRYIRELYSKTSDKKSLFFNANILGKLSACKFDNAINNRIAFGMALIFGKYDNFEICKELEMRTRNLDGKKGKYCIMLEYLEDIKDDIRKDEITNEKRKGIRGKKIKGESIYKVEEIVELMGFGLDTRRGRTNILNGLSRLYNKYGVRIGITTLKGGKKAFRFYMYK